jgi:hypothetical protein
MRWAERVTHMGERRGVHSVLWGILRERDHLEDPGVNGKIILRWIFRMWDVCYGDKHLFSITACRTCFLAVPRTVNVGLSLEMKQIHRSILKEICISYQFSAHVQTYGPNLDTKQTTTRQRLKWALKNPWLLPDRWCCLNDTGSNILFRNNWSLCGPIERSTFLWGQVTERPSTGPAGPI